MEVAALSSNVVSSNLGSTTGFRMETNQFSFRVMSDGLYQNKIGSPVREYCCNAYDSHVAAGKGDVPFEVHMPDTFNPMFYVQDYGLGLDDAGVRSTFATYFNSTKRNDNTAVGAFGLGSKTAFAYTDAFQIIAVKDGKRRMYSAFINADGIPDISNMGGEFSAEYVLWEGEEYEVPVLDQWDATDEVNGVRIVIPVTKPSDFQRFRNEVRTQLAFFPVKPVILNCPDGINWHTWADDESSSLRVDNVSVGSSRTDYAFRGLWAVQGPVGYKVDTELLRHQLSPAGWEALSVISGCAIMRFNLGEIEVTPSREGLSYSQRTLDAIEGLAAKLRSSMGARVKEKLEEAADPWAKAVLVNSNDVLRRMATACGVGFDAFAYYRNSGMYFVSLKKIARFDELNTGELDSTTSDIGLPFNTEWNGVIEQDGEVTAGDHDDDDADDVPADITDALNMSGLIFMGFSRSSRGRVRKWREGGAIDHVKPERYVKIIVEDTKDKPVVRMREFLSECGSHETPIKLVRRDGMAVTAAQIDMVRRALGASCDLIMLSSIAPPKREGGGTRAGYRVPKAYTWTVGDDVTDTTDWEREYDKLSDFDGAYYVIVERNTVHATRMDRFGFCAASYGKLDKPVMAIRRKDAEKLAGNPNWIRLRDKANELAYEIIQNPDFQSAFRASAYEGMQSIPDIGDSDMAEVLRAACKDGTIHADSPLYDYFNHVPLMTRVMARAKSRGWSRYTQNAFEALEQYTSRDPEVNGKLNARIKAQSVKVAERYPLLRHLSHAYGSYSSPANVAEHIVAYVNSQH